MKWNRILFLSVVALACVSTCLGAETEPASSAFSPFYKEVASMVGQAVFAALMFFGAWASKKLKEKFEVETEMLKTESIERWARRAAAYAEEKAEKYVKEHGIAMKSEEKLMEAAKWLAKKTGLKESTASEAVEATLPFVGMGATKATVLLRRSLETQDSESSSEG